MISTTLQSLLLVLPWLSFLLLLYAAYQCRVFLRQSKAVNPSSEFLVFAVFGALALAQINCFLIIRAQQIELYIALHGFIFTFDLVLLILMRRLVDWLGTTNSPLKPVEQLSLTDSRSGLASRLALTQHLIERLDAEQEFVLAILCLNRFKPLYQSLTPKAAQQLLHAIGLRLKAIDGCYIAQLTTHEFALVFDYHSEFQLHHRGREILATQQTTYKVKGRRLYLDASLGLALWPTHGKSVSALLGCADIALERSQSALNRYHLYRSVFEATALERMQMLADLRDAIAGDALSLLFQPIVEQETQQITGAEALVRWIKEDGTQLFADEFIPVAEKERGVIDLSNWVLNKSLQALAACFGKFRDFKLHVNLSPADLQDLHCWSRIEKALSENEVLSAALVVEIKESGLNAESGIALDVLSEIAKHDVTVVIDGYVVGASTLERLRGVSVDDLPIVGRVLTGIAGGSKGSSIAQSIIERAQNLNVKCSGVGGQSIEISDVLESLGCKPVRGYCFGLPLHDQAFYSLLGEGGSIEAAASTRRSRKAIK